MKKISIIILLMMISIVTFACSEESSGSSGSSGGTMQISLGAPPSSSAVYGYWVGATSAIESVYDEYNFTVVETSGAVDITERIRNGMVGIGNSVSNTDYENYNGLGDFEGEAFEDLRMIWYFDTTPMQWLVSKESGIEDFNDLEGEAFNPGSTNSSAEVITKQVLDVIDVTPDYFEANQSDAEDAVVNRQIIGTSKSGPAPDSFVQQIQGSLDVELLSFTDEQVEKITEEYEFLTPYTIPAGTYEGIDYDVQTVATMMGAQATTELSQEDGYKMLKAINEDGREEWENAYPVGADNDIIELTLESKVPLHAGAVQYIKEQGYDVPEELIPPEFEE